MAEFISRSPEETLKFGGEYSKNLKRGDVVILNGEMGAGKTVFVKGVAKGLGIADTVVSPTFNLMNEYEGRLTLYHYDAYRLHDALEAEEAGLTEYFGDRRGVCAVEWWQNISGAWAGCRIIRVCIQKTGEDTRSIEVVDE